MALNGLLYADMPLRTYSLTITENRQNNEDSVISSRNQTSIERLAKWNLSASI